jgi:excisionase family DNA binding protein
VNTSVQPIAYSIRDCAAALQVSERTIRRAIAAGKLQAIHIGRLVRVSSESLQQFVEAAQTKSQANFDELSASKGKTHVGSGSEENSHGSHQRAL